MKKIIVALVLSAVATGGAMAQSMLRIRLADNSPINVSVDGRYFNKRGTSVTVGDLPFGRHYFKVYATMQTRSGRTYEEVIYQGKVKTYYGRITTIVYDPGTRYADVQETDIDAYANNHPQSDNDNGQYIEHGADRRNEKSYYPDENGYNQPDVPASPVSPAEMSTLDDEKINKLKGKVSGENTDTKKINMMKAGLQEETMTTAQVGELMNWLSFESSKVDFAEWAYNQTVDKDLYSDLLVKFNYQNYKDELDQFIKSKK